MKKILFILTALLVVACSSEPNLVSTHKPILNIDAMISSQIDASVNGASAWVKNTSQQSIQLHYAIYWYAENGVTQPASDTQDAFTGTLSLQPQQTHQFTLPKPTPESVNYRLYLR